MRSQLSEEESCSGMRVSGRLAVVAEGELGADGEVLLRRTEMHVEVEGGEGDGLAFGVLRWGHLDFGGGRCGGRAGLRGRLTVLIGGAGEDDLSLIGLGLLRRRGRRGGWGGLRGEGESCHTGDSDGNSNEPAEKKLHEPRPFCFFGFDAAATAGAPASRPPAPSSLRAARRRWRKAS